MHVILPKTRVNLELKPWRRLPFFAILGPCSGVWDWQYKMVDLISSKVGEAVFFIPQRYPENHPFQRLRIVGEEFERALDFENYYIKLAADHEYGHPRGAAVLWFPNQTTPRTDGLGYAHDSLREGATFLGQLMGGKKLRLSIGAESVFPELSTLRRSYELELVGFPFHSRMTLVAETAAWLAMEHAVI